MIKQDDEYLVAIKAMLAKSLEPYRTNIEPILAPRQGDDDSLDVLAAGIMAVVEAAGLKLLTESDWQDMVNAYILQILR